MTANMLRTLLMSASIIVALSFGTNKNRPSFPYIARSSSVDSLLPPSSAPFLITAESFTEVHSLSPPCRSLPFLGSFSYLALTLLAISFIPASSRTCLILTIMSLFGNTYAYTNYTSTLQLPSSAGFSISPATYGGYYATGFINTDSGYYATWAAKLSPEASLLWNTTLTSYVSSVGYSVATIHGALFEGLVVAGYVFDDSKYIPYIWKFDDFGHLLWESNALSVGRYAFAVTVLANGSYVMAGSTIFDNLFLATFDSDGNLFWSQIFNVDSTGYTSIANTAEDGVAVVTNNRAKTCSFVVVNSSGSSEVTVEGLSWSTDSHCSSVAVLSGGGYCIGGHAASSSGNYDAWVAKLDAAGNVAWSQIYGGTNTEYVAAVAEAADGNLFFAGSINSTRGDLDFLLFKTDASGSFLSERTYGREEIEFAYGMCNPGAEIFATIGYTNSSTDSGSTEVFVVATNYSNCPIGQYPESGTEACIACPVGQFKDTDDAAACQDCPVGTYQGTAGSYSCIDCPPGEYQAPNRTTCYPCSNGCASCLVSTNCSLCSAFYRTVANLDNTFSCQFRCPDKYYVSGFETCSPCHPRCLSCNDSTAEHCDACLLLPGIEKDATLGCTCAQGYFANATTELCQSCPDSLCLSCNSTDPDLCSLCSASVKGLFETPVNHKCVCEAGKYRNGDHCSTCNPLCTECTGPTSNDCVKCATNSYSIETDVHTCVYMCITSDDDMYFDVATKMCKYCPSPCQSCYDSGTKCFSCISGYFLTNGTCVQTCPAKTYASAGLCSSCSPRCVSCTNQPSYCLDGCTSPYVFKDHACLESCGQGYCNVSGLCEECDEGCEECEFIGSAKVCSKCDTSKVLFQGACLAACPERMYVDSSRVCQECDVACSRCFGPSSQECYTCNSTLGFIQSSDYACAYPSCTKGTYFNSTTLSCQSCPSTCSECANSRNCTGCVKGYTLNYGTKKCYDPCDKSGITKKATGGCTEVCGDGKNMGVLECDDGNQIDGDGCSSQCTVEENYQCSGGNEYTADTCVLKKAPEIKSFKYWANRSAVLTFGQLMTLNKTANLSEVITLTLKGADSPYMEWTCLSFDRKRFRKMYFNLAYNQSLLGTEMLILTFLKPAMFTDLLENPLIEEQVKVKVTKYKYISDSSKQATENLGSFSLYTTLTSLGLSLVVSLLFNTPIEGMWISVSVLQMISYLTLINVNFPENLLTFLGYIESAHDFNKWFPNPFTYIFAESKMNMTSYNEQFSSRGFTNRNMLYLCGSDLALLAMTALMIVCLIPLARCFRLFDSVLKKIRYSSISRSFIQAYLKVCLAAMVNIGIYSFSNPERAISSLIAIVVGILLVGIPAFISEFLYQNYELALHSKDFASTHASYISGFRVKANILNLMFYPIFMFRRLTFAATITILADYPLVQLPLISIGTLAFVLYMFFRLPFKSKFSLYSSITAELSFAAFTAMLFGFVTPRPDSTGTMMGWVMIGLMLVSLSVSWLCVLIQQIRVWRFRRLMREKRAKAAQDQSQIRVGEPSCSRESAKITGQAQDSPSRLRVTKRQLDPVDPAGPVEESKSDPSNKTMQQLKTLKTMQIVVRKKSLQERQIPDPKNTQITGSKTGRCVKLMRGNTSLKHDTGTKEKKGNKVARILHK